MSNDERRTTNDARRSAIGDRGTVTLISKLTDCYDEPKPPWRTRKERYVEHLPRASPSALRVSLADKLDNVRAILDDPGAQGRRSLLAERRDGRGPDDVRWYYATLAARFRVLATRSPSRRAHAACRRSSASQVRAQPRGSARGARGRIATSVLRTRSGCCSPRIGGCPVQPTCPSGPKGSPDDHWLNTHWQRPAEPCPAGSPACTEPDSVCLPPPFS